MTPPAAAPSLLTRQWMVALITLFLSGSLIVLALGGPNTNAELAHTMGLMAMTVIVYAWGLFPTAGSLCFSLLILLCVAWLWAAQHTFALGVDVAACATLVGIAALHRRRLQRRFYRLQQVLDDVGDQRTAKDQLITGASQTREALQKKLSRYTQLQSIAEELSNLTDVSAIAQLAVDRALSLIGKSDVCLLFLVDKEQQELSLFASKKRDTLPSIRAKHGDQFDRYVLRTHRPLLVNDVRRDFRFTVTITPERPISSVIACPLLLGQSPEGVLRLDSAQPGIYTQDDLRLLDILLDLVSLAITNAKLFAQTQRLAMTDGLTGLTLRRPFLEQLTRELTRAGRGRDPVSVLMLDVDHFKSYNDTFGHVAGDLVLQSVAEMLRTVVPSGGVIARYGGEEFAVLLPRLPKHQASEVAEQIRRVIERHVQAGNRAMSRGAEASLRGAASGSASSSDARDRGTQMSAVSAARSGVQRPAATSSASDVVTVSIGVATFPDDAQAELELIRVADQRLYHAKHSGRNLVCAS